MHRYRSHTCGELRATDVGTDVRLSGWLHNRRNLGGILFIDLRDHYGIDQLVVAPRHAPAYEALTRRPRRSWSASTARSSPRGAENVNPELPTGEIEVEVAEVEVLGAAEPLPFTDQRRGRGQRGAAPGVPLPRPAPRAMHRNIMLRTAVIAAIRAEDDRAGLQRAGDPDPVGHLARGRPRLPGPSRLHPGKFYALPQAPQQFKQLLMIAGLRPLLPDRALLPRRGRRAPTARRASSTSSTWR